MTPSIHTLRRCATAEPPRPYPWGVCLAIVDVMHSAIRRARRGTASATGLLIVLTVFGVLLMHSVTPTTSMSMSMPMTTATSAPMTPATSGGHAPESLMHPLAESGPVMAAEHRCPPTHHMMHPCVGTTMSSPALSVPAISAEIDLPRASMNPVLGRTDSTWGRAPPWTLWELDRSVTLRV